jgi:hypothetical protein
LFKPTAAHRNTVSFKIAPSGDVAWQENTTLTLCAWSSCLLMIGERQKLFTLIYFGSVGMMIILKWILKKAQDRHTLPSERGNKTFRFHETFGIS